MANSPYCYLGLDNFEGDIRKSWSLLETEKYFCDVTLSCGEKQIETHKVIISSFSQVFKDILKLNQNEHPLIYLKGVKYQDLQNIVTFMYKGEVNILMEEMDSFLQVAKDLKIRGLPRSNQGYNFYDRQLNSKTASKKERIIQNNFEKNDCFKITQESEVDSTDSLHNKDNSVSLNILANKDIFPLIEFESQNLSAQNFDSSSDLETKSNVFNNQSPSINQENSIDNQPDKVSLEDKDQDTFLKNLDSIHNQENDRKKPLVPDVYRQSIVSDNTEQLQFVCANCGKTYNTKVGLRQHVNTTHLGLFYSCNECNYKAKQKQNLKLHKQKTHEGKRYTCDQCSKEYISSLGLQQHIESVHNGVCYNCDQCDYKAATKNNLKIHAGSHHEGAQYLCDQCDKIFRSKQNLSHHVNIIHKGIGYPCNQCDYKATMKTSLKLHIESVHEKIPHPCNQCDKVWASKRRLKEHVEITHQNAGRCDQCDYKATRKEYIRKHILKYHN